MRTCKDCSEYSFIWGCLAQMYGVPCVELPTEKETTYTEKNSDLTSKLKKKGRYSELEL